MLEKVKVRAGPRRNRRMRLVVGEWKPQLPLVRTERKCTGGGKNTGFVSDRLRQSTFPSASHNLFYCFSMGNNSCLRLSTPGQQISTGARNIMCLGPGETAGCRSTVSRSDPIENITLMCGPWHKPEKRVLTLRRMNGNFKGL